MVAALTRTEVVRDGGRWPAWRWRLWTGVPGGEERCVLSGVTLRRSTAVRAAWAAEAGLRLGLEAGARL